MVSAIISVATSIGGAVAGAAGAVFSAGGLTTIVRAAAFIYTAVDALTNKSNSALNSGATSPTYSFGQLHTQVSNLMPRPIIYGKVKVAGNKIWQTGENTSTIKMIVSLGEGEVSSITDVKLNDEPITSFVGCTYDAYYGDGVQEINTRVPGASDADRATKVGGLKYDSYLALTAQASKNLSSSGFNVTCIVEGRKIRVYNDINTYTTQYSNNPAWCILDFLTCYNGCGVSINEIDVQSFISAASYCEEPVNNQERFNLNIVLDAKKSRLDWLNAMLLVCRGYLVYRNGKIYIMIDKSGSSVQAFNSNNIIIGSEKFWTTPRENKYDVVKVQFIDPDNEYARVYAIAELPNYGNEQPIVKTVEAFGITNFKQASRLAWFYLNESATTNKFLSFLTTKEGLDRTVGDIISVSSSVMGYTDKLFRITTLNEEQEGQIEIICKEYNANLYTDTAGSVAPSIDTTDSSSSFNTAITDITIQGNSETDQTRVLQQLIDNLSDQTGGTINVDAAENGVYLNAALNVKSNVHLNFKCPVFLGKYGQIRIYGEFYETPDSDLPQIRADLTAGTNVIYCGEDVHSQASNYNIGDRIVIRGHSDGNGQATEYQEATITGVDTINNNITISEGLDYDFKASYPTSDYEENYGVIDRTYITFMTFGTLAEDKSRGECAIALNDASAFSVGDWVFLGDNKTPAELAGDSANTFKHEINRIIDISGNTLSLQNAICHNYETAYDAYIIKMNMTENATISGAIVNYKAEPDSFTTNAFTIAYAKDCCIRNCEVKNDGSYTSKGHGFRIDRSINCTVENCTIMPPKHIEAAEGYGFTIYRGNHNTINNCRAYGCRHSFLLFRGASNNRLTNIYSINARVSDIDFHGGDESYNIVDGFTIVGGDQKYGSNLSAIKFGNEYHVTGCYNNVVRNGSVTNYNGYGIDIVPISENNLLANVSFKNIDSFIRAVDLSRDETLTSVNNRIKSCTINTVNSSLGNINSTVNGSSSQTVDGLSVDNCTFTNVSGFFSTFKYTKNCRIINNTFLNNSEVTDAPWFIDAQNSDNLHIWGNVIHKGTKFVKINTCNNLLCKDNKLINFYDTVILDDVGNNTDYIFRNNDTEGFIGSYEASQGGSDGVVQNSGRALTEVITSTIVKATGLNVTEHIPFDGSTPEITEGREILNCVYKPVTGNYSIKIECIVPAVYTDIATNAVLALFKENVCIAATGIRLPNTGSSSGHFLQLTCAAGAASGGAFPLSLRLGPKTSGPTLTIGDRFNGLAIPYINITETELINSKNYIYTENLSGLILTEDYEQIEKE